MNEGLQDLAVLKLAEGVADTVWHVAHRWSSLAQDTVGKQIIRSSDSIGANIAESYGRFHYSDKVNFLYYARGSLFETKYWLNRCGTRKLMEPKQVDTLVSDLGEIVRQLNGFIRYLKQQKRQPQTKKLKEDSPTYQIDSITLFTEDEINWLLSTGAEALVAEPENLQSLIFNQSRISNE